MTIHLKKLCVGANDVRDLFNRQEFIRQKYSETIHITRMFPKKYQDLLLDLRNLIEFLEVE